MCLPVWSPPCSVDGRSRAIGTSSASTAWSDASALSAPAATADEAALTAMTGPGPPNTASRCRFTPWPPVPAYTNCADSDLISGLGATPCSVARPNRTNRWRSSHFWRPIRPAYITGAVTFERRTHRRPTSEHTRRMRAMPSRGQTHNPTTSESHELVRDRCPTRRGNGADGGTL